MASVRYNKVIYLEELRLLDINRVDRDRSKRTRAAG